MLEAIGGCAAVIAASRQAADALQWSLGEDAIVIEAESLRGCASAHATLYRELAAT
jgi:hypothetical protein